MIAELACWLLDTPTNKLCIWRLFDIPLERFKNSFEVGFNRLRFEAIVVFGFYVAANELLRVAFLGGFFSPPSGIIDVTVLSFSLG